MRMTVGPLPPAVYWRRRAIVLGGALVIVLLVSYSCGADSGGSGTVGLSGDSGTPTAVASPSGDTPSAGVSAVPSAAQSASASVAPGSAVVDPSLCADDELRVTARPERTQSPRGAGIVITLLVKNVSGRTCTRDVGADLQELRIVLGTEKIWSSDDCNGPRGHDLREFPPDHERSYAAFWNGRSSIACTKELDSAPDGPIPAAGDYTLVARVGTALSAPVELTLT